MAPTCVHTKIAGTKLPLFLKSEQKKNNISHYFYKGKLAVSCIFTSHLITEFGLAPISSEEKIHDPDSFPLHVTISLHDRYRCDRTSYLYKVFPANCYLIVTLHDNTHYSCLLIVLLLIT